MERLTQEGFNYDRDFAASNLQSWPIAQALKRLAAYEDTGLTPAQITELAKRRHDCKITCLLDEYNKVCAELSEYRKAKEDGRMVELPCKVGGIVWVITPDCMMAHDGKVWSFTINAIGINKNGVRYAADGRNKKQEYRMMSFSLEQFGKTVFLTREAALKAQEGAE